MNLLFLAQLLDNMVLGILVLGIMVKRIAVVNTMVLGII